MDQLKIKKSPNQEINKCYMRRNIMKGKIKLTTLLLIGLLSVMGALVITGCGKEDQQTETATAESGQLWTCGMHPEVIVDEPGQCPKCGMDLVPVKQTGGEQPVAQTADQKSQGKRKILYWQAPMNPTEIYDRPGKSAMGMDLIPVYEDEAGMSSGGTVSIDPVTVQNMGVRYGKVERMDFSRVIRTVGEINFNEDKLYDINSKISGWIEKLYVNYTGEIVKKGQPLLEIYSPDLVTTQEEYLLALKTRKMVSGSSFKSIREGGESLLESTRKRLLYWDIPPSEIERLEKTGEVRKTIQLQAPAGGMVVERNVVDGAHVKSGEKLFRIADLSSVWVHASIYDYEVPWVREGQPAEMDLSYQPGKTYQGKVAYIYPYLREKARDVHVRLEFNNPDLDLKPGMYVNVQLQSRVIPNTLVVPSEAVIRSGRRNVIFVTREPGKFEPRDIRIGEEGGPGNRYLRVLSGLLEGETVVTSAQFMLDSESRLQEAIQKMLQEKMNKSQQPAVQQHEMQEMEQPQEHQH
jgi:Cu(I)/Ag(I) efflux system membrane fusion protein/cobalt-zinc-cadmium efflux system membrane fusion protein